jgi:hypothetical protein
MPRREGNDLAGHRLKKRSHVNVIRAASVQLSSTSMNEKLKSRKLWVTVLAAALVSLLSQLGFDDEMIQQIVDLATVYILGEAGLDVVKVIRGGGPPPKLLREEALDTLKRTVPVLVLIGIAMLGLTSCFVTGPSKVSVCYEGVCASWDIEGRPAPPLPQSAMPKGPMVLPLPVKDSGK